MSAQTIVQIIVSVITAGVTIGSIIYKFGSFSAKIETKVDVLGGQIKSIVKGDSPECARHSERLDAHEKTLEDHGHRIVALENKRRSN